MKKLKLHLENCYGIKALTAEFDFSDRRAFAIYAPNGAMKSSLAQTFKDLADGKPSKDRVFSKRKCVRTITDENGVDVPASAVMVIRNYEEEFGCDEKTSTLLVDQDLRKEYEKIHDALVQAKKALLRALDEQSGSRLDLENEVSVAFTLREKQFLEALNRVRTEVAEQTTAPFADVPYDKIFNDKVLAVLNTKDFKTVLASYVKRYNELLDKSSFFRKGVFNYWDASQIAKSLADHGFFDAKHTVNLTGDAPMQIATVEELEKLIKRELEQLASDPQLRSKFTELQKFLEKNQTVRDFFAYISYNEHLIPQLTNIGAFRQDVFKSYFKAREQLYQQVLDQIDLVKEATERLKEAAKRQRTQWQEAVDIFNARFFVPFTLEVVNQFEVMVGEDRVPSLAFKFEEEGEAASLAYDELVNVLSTGEKKALYILNIIFQLEVRKKARDETIFIIDDVADSFDYKNKYAIIQYLKDIDEESYFHQIILTHNFDFFRTINSRSLVPYSHCLMASRIGKGIQLKQATGIKNPFIRDWKAKFATEDRKKVACIPFMRNLIEYTRGEDVPEYSTLTSLLHWKADSSAITVAQLEQIYGGLFGAAPKATSTRKRLVVPMIEREAQSCLRSGNGLDLENKIVLSIAIRLAAERFMVTKINNPSVVQAISENQTQGLLAEFKRRFGGDPATQILDRVVLMTPENIHLNSFMYEPILDMADDHLKSLYSDVLLL